MYSLSISSTHAGMEQTRAIVSLIIFAFVLSVSVSGAMGADSKRPNIIFIFADDWGYGDLGIHGSTFCKTPNLDRMAAEGIDFQNFTVNNPVCSPSRTAVLTGQFPARHCVHQHFHMVKHHIRTGMPDWLDPNAPMLPRMLQEAGYVTAHFGKWHLCNDEIPDGPLPTDYGYDEFGAFDLPGEAPMMPCIETCPHAVDFIKRHASAGSNTGKAVFHQSVAARNPYPALPTGAISEAVQGS